MNQAGASPAAGVATGGGDGRSLAVYQQNARHLDTLEPEFHEFLQHVAGELREGHAGLAAIRGEMSSLRAATIALVE